METTVQQEKKYPKKGRLCIDVDLMGPLCMISAALLFTMMSLLVKQMDPRYTVWHIGFIRLAGGGLLLLAIFGRHHNLYRGNNIPMLIFRGCTGTVAFIASVTAIRLLPISTSVVIFYSFPVFAALFGAIIYKERIGLSQILCILMVMAGVALLFDFKFSVNLFGQCMALMAGLFAGLTVTLVSSLREQNGSVIIYLYFCTVGAVVTSPVFILNPVIPATSVEWLMVTGIIVTSLIAQLLMNQGFFYCRGWEGGVYMSSETLFTSVAGIVFMNDHVSWRFWVGGSIILGSGLLLNWLRLNARDHLLHSSTE